MIFSFFHIWLASVEFRREKSSTWHVASNFLIIIIIIIIFTSLRERDKREKSEEKIDRHHQDSNQGPSLAASDALTTELWCSRHPSRGCSTFSSDFVTHTSCESTQAGGTQPSLYPHTSRTL